MQNGLISIDLNLSSGVYCFLLMNYQQLLTGFLTMIIYKSE